MFRTFKTLALAAVIALGAAAGTAQAYGTKDRSADAGTIVDVAMNAGSFNTLVAAVKAADLVGTLSGEGPFTVFAPTDAAFEKLPAGTVEMLLQPENKDTLVKVLTYHVVAGKVMAADVASGAVPTVAGEEAMVKVDMGKVMIDSAQVVQTDIMASNGVIHVIDQVILPSDVQAALTN